MRPQLTQTASGWRLAPHVHAVAADDDLVFLDIAADAYSCLPGGALAVRLRPGSAALSVEDPELIAGLAAAALIVPADVELAPRRAPPPRPAATAVTGAIGPPAWGDLPTAAIGLVDLLGAYRGRRFADILACAAATPVPTRRRSARAPSLLEIVDRFHSWIPYAPVSGKCLLRSFILLRGLRRAGHDAEWVFGVRTWPFAAHCWLQVGDLALDDDHERLTPFHPILAI